MAQNIDKAIQARAEAESSLNNYKKLISHWRDTGEWIAGDLGISTSPLATPKNFTKEEVDDLIASSPESFSEERIAGRISQLEDDVSKSIFRSERKQIRINQGITDVEDISDEEFLSLAKRNKELRILQESDPKAFEKIFNPDVTIPGTNEKLKYAIHSGAPELSGGALDPSFSIGSTGHSSEGAGDTKGANRAKAREFRQTMDSEVAGMSAEEKALRLRQLELITDPDQQKLALSGLQYTESGNFLSAAPPSAGVHQGYFGRIDWNGRLDSSYRKFKTAEEAAGLAHDFDATTGGRGSMYLVRGVKDYTINTSGLNADYGETPILGRHKPIGGLSSTTEDLTQFISGQDLQTGEIKLDKNLKRIDLAWLEKQINEDIAKVTSGKVPLEEIFGPAAEHAGLKTSISKSVQNKPNALIGSMKKAEETVAARVASNAIPQTIEEGVSIAVRRSGTRELLAAGAHAAQAVAHNDSAAMRIAGAAATILRKRI